MLPCERGWLILSGMRWNGLAFAALLAVQSWVCGQSAPSPNLARVTRFPLGLQSGAALGRTFSEEDCVVAPDPSMPGPSGVASLLIDNKGSSQPVIVFLSPEEMGEKSIKYTISLAIRGAGFADINVMADGKQFAGKRVNASGAWVRMEEVFAPQASARLHQVMVAVWGRVWIDGFQLERGEKASEFRPAMVCEVALGFPKSDASVTRIQFEDEPPELDWAVMGPGKTLKCKVVDIHGNAHAIDDVPLRPGSMQSGFVRYDVLGEEKLGPFRVEAWVEDEQGKRISRFNEMLILRIKRPRHWGEDAPRSPFGIHAGSVHRQLLMSKAIGINWTRLHDPGSAFIAWAYLEPEKGKWQWFDRDIQRYRDHCISILGGLQQSPGWASGYGGGTPTEYWAHYLEPLNFAEYGNYVRMITTRYQGVINVWDVWNEPWLKFWSKWDAEKKKSYRSPHAAEEYVELAKVAFETTKAVNPKLEVLGVNTTGRKIGESWTRDVAAAGGLKPCDIYCYHHYTNELSGFPGDIVEKCYQDAWGPAMAKLGGAAGAGKLDKRVWMSEGSGTRHVIDGGMYHYSAPGMGEEDVLETCDRLTRYEVAILGQGVEKIFLYSINMGGEFHPGPGEFQTLVTSDAYPHPCAASHSAMAWELEDTYFFKRVPVARGVYAYLFSGAGRSVAVITSAKDYGRYRPPTIPDAMVRDLFANPVEKDREFDGRVMYVEAPMAAERLAELLKMEER
jgi:hypothetical protein